VNVSRTIRAKKDLAEIFLWYEENGDGQLAGKFLEAADMAFHRDSLARGPSCAMIAA